MAESYALRSLFFRLEAERAHEMALAGARFLGAVPGAGRLAGVRYRVDDPRLAVAAFGLEFSNPVGLAAGAARAGVAHALRSPVHWLFVAIAAALGAGAAPAVLTAFTGGQLAGAGLALDRGGLRRILQRPNPDIPSLMLYPILSISFRASPLSQD